MENIKITKGENSLLTMDDASRFLCIKKSTLYHLVMEKKISHVKVGRLNRFRLEDLQAYIEKNLVEPVKTDTNKWE